MWESRPLPKIVRDPLAAFSARGSFLYGARLPDPPAAGLPFRNFAAHRRNASDKRAPARSRACQAIGVQKIVLSLLTRGRAVRMVE